MSRTGAPRRGQVRSGAAAIHDPPAHVMSREAAILGATRLEYDTRQTSTQVEDIGACAEGSSVDDGHDRPLTSPLELDQRPARQRPMGYPDDPARVGMSARGGVAIEPGAIPGGRRCDMPSTPADEPDGVAPWLSPPVPLARPRFSPFLCSPFLCSPFVCAPLLGTLLPRSTLLTVRSRRIRSQARAGGDHGSHARWERVGRRVDRRRGTGLRDVEHAHGGHDCQQAGDGGVDESSQSIGRRSEGRLGVFDRWRTRQGSDVRSRGTHDGEGGDDGYDRDESGGRSPVPPHKATHLGASPLGRGHEGTVSQVHHPHIYASPNA
jgi:hypothetical protein